MGILCKSYVLVTPLSVIVTYYSHRIFYYLLFLQTSHSSSTLSRVFVAFISSFLNRRLKMLGRTILLLACSLAKPTLASLPHRSFVIFTASRSKSLPTPMPLMSDRVVQALMIPLPPWNDDTRLCLRRFEDTTEGSSRWRTAVATTSFPYLAPITISSEFLECWKNFVVKFSAWEL